MTRSALITAAMGLAFGTLPASASPTPPALQEARALELAADPAWVDLLHYAPAPLSGHWRSLADDPGFFLAADGARDPAAELDASLTALLSPARPEAPDDHPQCRFPARYHWLKSRLPGSAPWPDQPCPRLAAWIAGINPAGATLIFPSAYVNSPASMFGHTLLRIDVAGQSEATRLLAYTINYAAKADATDGFSFAAKGLTGLYPGILSSSPYYAKVREYSDMESRDVWEYPLTLTVDETRQLLRHAWEIGATRFDYWFFDENCSYMILRLLDVARPGLRTAQRFPLSAIPVDTVKGVVAVPGLVAGASFRPAAGTELAYRAGRLSAEEMDSALAVADGRRPPASLGQDPRAIEQLEFADRLVSYRGHAGKLEQDEALARLRSIQSVRSTLPTIDVGQPPVPPRPEQGHASGRFGLGAGRLGGDPALFMDLRPAYHDLLDPEAGYARGAQIRFFDLGASQRQGQGWRIDRFLPVDIVSVAPRQSWTQPLSWKVRFGWERSLGASQATSPTLAGGPGAAWEWDGRMGRLIGYVFLENQLVVHGKLDKHWAIGSGPLTGLLWDAAPRLRLQLEAGHQWFNDNHLQRSQVQAHLRQSLGPRDNLVAGYTWTRIERSGDDEADRRISIGWQHYF
ncbi:Lnb N-terminal periplasmic domain-containing protein [Zoogloea dura]|uniref:DUF4105 domain-containing protein n=1 Tax=Zoogloea dura TaxID=2728840 RepID=A0A848G3P6_9RHOO|nr:DUF4105 domain-containing protein [Zoogloea dura]NML25842.1 DUF4105 domain-containing protein [Zoogloea dura]